MKKFRCVVTRTDEYVIELDETVFTEEYMEEFRGVFYPFYSLDDHAEHLAKMQAIIGDDSFIEGYGHVLRDGKLPFSGADFDKDGAFLPEEQRRKPAQGINIIIEDEDECDVEVTEVK